MASTKVSPSPPASSIIRGIRLALRAVRSIPGKRAFKQPDRGFAALVSQHYAHDVEAAGGMPIAFQSPYITLGDRQDVQFLGGIDCHLRRHEAALCLGLDLNETEYATVPSDQIDFASIVRRAEVLRDNAIALIPEMEVGFHLSAAGGREMLRFLPAEMMRRIIQGTGDESGEPEHKLSTVNKALNLNCSSTNQ